MSKTVQLSGPQWDALAEMAEKEGVSRSKVLRDLLIHLGLPL